LRLENLESDRKRQRQLDVFLRCMNALVCDYWNENRDWTCGERGYDTELFARYAMLLNYLERRSGRRFRFRSILLDGYLDMALEGFPSPYIA
jgi:hypothetical protein